VHARDWFYALLSKSSIPRLSQPESWRPGPEKVDLVNYLFVCEGVRVDRSPNAA
jgi:hypothetical protein